VLNNYATEHLNMTADAKVSNNQDYSPNYLTSPLGKRYSECSDEVEDVQQLAQDCMLHECNRYCLKSTKARTPRTCRSHYGTKSEFGKLDTPGMDLIEKAQIKIERKGISHFRMRRTHSVQLVQNSKSLLKAWRANCDIKLLLYHSNPSHPDIPEIEDVCKYVVAYTRKRHNTTQVEKEAIQNIIMG
jgi:hypothetical protein